MKTGDRVNFKRLVPCMVGAIPSLRMQQGEGVLVDKSTAKGKIAYRIRTDDGKEIVCYGERNVWAK